MAGSESGECWFTRSADLETESSRGNSGESNNASQEINDDCVKYLSQIAGQSQAGYNIITEGELEEDRPPLDDPHSTSKCIIILLECGTWVGGGIDTFLLSAVCGTNYRASPPDSTNNYRRLSLKPSIRHNMIRSEAFVDGLPCR